MSDILYHSAWESISNERGAFQWPWILPPGQEKQGKTVCKGRKMKPTQEEGQRRQTDGGRILMVSPTFSLVLRPSYIPVLGFPEKTPISF